MGIKDLAKRRADLFYIDPMIIVEDDGWNVREDTPELLAHIHELRDSIKAVGVKDALTVYMRGDTPVLTDGHCRLAAVKLAIADGALIHAVPTRVEDKTANEADRVATMLVRRAGKPLTPQEQSSVVKRLMAYGWTQKEIAEKTGYSPSKIADLVALSGASMEVAGLIKDGKVSPTTAARTIRKHGQEEAEKKLKDAVDEAEESGKDKVTLADMAGKSHTAHPPEIWNDGFHAGMIHALSLLVDNTGNMKLIKEYRSMLFADDKIRLSVATPSDRQILESVFQDL